MNIPRDKELYEDVKKIIFKKYKKNSAYRSGGLQRSYKKEFINKYGEDVEPYLGNRETGNLSRWFKEDWRDISNLPYPVYRPTKIISKELTPLTVEEIDPYNLLSQSLIKQFIKGEKNLSPFKEKMK
jgi:hypothetical protein